MSGNDTTRASLLLRLRRDPDNQSAWAAFVGRYGPQIHAWCRRWGLQPADAEDVTQIVLIKVAKLLPKFTYDATKSFRAWLHALTRHARADLLEDQYRYRDHAGELLRSSEAWDDLTDRLEQAHRHEVLERAMLIVRERVEAHTWEAFRLTAIDAVTAAEAATRLGIGIAVVYRARSVVQEMLRREVRSFDPESTLW